MGGAEKVAVAEGEPVEDAEGEGKEDDVALVVALSVHTGPVNIPYTSTVEPTSRRRRNTPGPPGSRSAGAKLQEWAMGGGSRDPTAPPHEKNAMIAVIIIIGKASPRKTRQSGITAGEDILGGAGGPAGARRAQAAPVPMAGPKGPPVPLPAGPAPPGGGTHLMAVLTLASTPLGRR